MRPLPAGELLRASAWSTHDSIFLNDLLPLPYTQKHCSVSPTTSTRCKRRWAAGCCSSPPTYLLFAESTIEKTAFLAEIARRTGCDLLLDVNNVFVTATNHDLDPDTYIARFPLEAVCEIHLDGHCETVDDLGARLLIDSHDTPVKNPVWALYQTVLDPIGPVASLIEWDNDVPAWLVLRDEVVAAQRMIDAAARQRAA